MRITTSQLQTHHKSLIDALKRGEAVEITYHGNTLGIVQPQATNVDSDSQSEALEAFFEMHKDQSSTEVEKELRQVRQSRRNRTL